MLTGKHIENARQHAGIPLYIICNTMDLNTESEYKAIVSRNKIPTIYQQIMIFTVFEEYRESMPILCV